MLPESVVKAPVFAVNLLGRPETSSGVKAGRLFSGGAWGLTWSLSAPQGVPGPGQTVHTVTVRPIDPVFRYLRTRSRIQVWLYEQVNMGTEGCVTGSDEYVNLVSGDAEETRSQTKPRKQLGCMML